MKPETAEQRGKDEVAGAPPGIAGGTARIGMRDFTSL
jgi:hypothetical protein